MVTRWHGAHLEERRHWLRAVPVPPATSSPSIVAVELARAGMMAPRMSRAAVSDSPSEATAGLVAAVDIGGSGLRAARFVDGRLEGHTERALSADLTSAQIEERLRSALGEVCGEHCAAVGVCFPAFLDADGRVRDALNLSGLTGMDLAAVARAATGAPRVDVFPDSAAAALAEALAGSGRGSRRVLTVVVGTGCNAGMAVDGEVVALGGGSLGDAGHAPVAFNDVSCWCGGRGCLEAALSGLAFDRQATELGLRDARALLEAASAGHAGAASVVERAGRALGSAVAAWAAVLWPERVVVGGGIGLACGDALLEAAAEQMRRVGTPYLVRDVEFVPSSLGRQAPLLGAALAARAAASPVGLR